MSITKMTTLPVFIGQLVKLESFVLSDKKLESLPLSVSLAALSFRTTPFPQKLLLPVTR
jgi:hypothetical protein